MGELQIKRAYVTFEKTDGKRVLVDRMWPRGIKKEKLALDLWEKEIAPTNELRKEFGHDPQKFAWFKKNYQKELDQNERTEKLKTQIDKWLAEGNVTLIYGAKDEVHNQAVVLKEYLLKK